MLRLLLYFSFIGNIIAQFRDPVLTIAPSPIRPLPTFGPIVPVRTIRPILTTIQNTTIQNITTTISTIPTQTTEPDNETINEDFDPNLFFLIIPSGLVLLFFIYLCLKKKRQHLSVVNIDLNIENKIPVPPVQTDQHELTNQPSNVSEHFYEEIDYEARYEMPITRGVNYDNIIEENEYGTPVTTSI